MKVFVIIVGAGDLGSYLAELLLDEGHDVVVIDKRPEVCEKIAEKLDVQATCADATDPKAMEKVNCREAEALVALTESDETNMVVSFLAKEMGVVNVAARIEKVEYDESVLKKLGIDIVIHPKAAAAGYIAELITKPEVMDLVFLSRGEAVIMELKVEKNSRIVGKKMKEIEHPAGSAIIALIVGGEKVEIPNSDSVIKVGDKILVLAKKEVAEKVSKMVR